MVWDEFDEVWRVDDQEWVDPEEERENRDYAIVTAWQQGVLDELVKASAGPERVAALRLIDKAKRITGRQSPPEGVWTPAPRIQW